MQLSTTSASFIAVATLSWWLAAVFAALTARAAVVPPRGVSPKALGLGELAATLVVAVVSLLVV